MDQSGPCLRTLDELREFVSQTLCEYESLDARHYPLHESVMVRRRQPCGIRFLLFGPRRTCLSAIWETDQNTVLFYNTAGERFLRARLPAAVGSTLLMA